MPAASVPSHVRFRCLASSIAGWARGKAIFRPYPQAIPNVYGISKAAGRAPCKASCPAGVNVQGYVALLAQGKIKEAYDVVRERCPLPAVCGPRVPAPLRNQVQPQRHRRASGSARPQALCRRLRLCPPQRSERTFRLRRRCSRRSASRSWAAAPAGLTAATDLRSKGYGVTIFDAMPFLGGMLRYGIPRYRLPGDVLDHEIQYILDMGIEARTSTRVADPHNCSRPALLLASPPASSTPFSWRPAPG